MKLDHRTSGLDRSLSSVRISGGSFARFWVEFTDRRMAEVSASKVECGDYGRCMAVVWIGFCSPSSPIWFGGGGVENRRPEAGLGVRRDRGERV